MSERQTVAERERQLRSRPVEYHDNGRVKFPATYSQLLHECERLKEDLEEARAAAKFCFDEMVDFRETYVAAKRWPWLEEAGDE